MSNVDTSASNEDRVSTMWEIITQVTSVIDGSDNDPASVHNKKAFLLHVAWHEGARLTTRYQTGGGPGRSFFQFEAPRAKEAVAYAFQRNWEGYLASSSGQLATDIRNAGNALPNSGAWPAGNLIESLLATNDLFAAYLARIAFAKIPAPIPVGNQAHAIYWADHWKIVFNPPSDRDKLIATVKQEADEVDQLIPNQLTGKAPIAGNREAKK